MTSDTRKAPEYKRIYPEPVALTEAEQKQLDSLQAEYAALDAAWNAFTRRARRHT